MQYSVRIDHALKLATQLHHGQVRKDVAQTSYIMHPVAVMCILSRHTSDEDVLVAALLHDVLEDVLLPYGEKVRMLEDRFGARVLHIIYGVTEEKDPLVDPEEQSGWKERKLKYLERLAQSSQESVLVSAADKIHNLMSIADGIREEGEAFWRRFDTSEEKLWFYEEVLAVVERKTHGPIVQELRAAIETVRALLSIDVL